MRRMAAVIVLLTAVACARDRGTPPSPVAPALLSAAAASVTDTVVGPDSVTSVCSSLPAGSQVRVRLIALAGTVASTVTQACPANVFTLTAPDGIYMTQVIFLSGAPGSLPTRYLETLYQYVPASPSGRRLIVPNGRALGGRVLFDGGPLEGMDFSLTYTVLRSFLAVIGTSDASGHWIEAGGRPVYLQSAGFVTQIACRFLGGRTTVVPPDTFYFPMQRDAMDCAGETGATPGFSHDLTRLVMTPGPGDIGMTDPPAAEEVEYGAGWGVQFPVIPPARPRHLPVQASHMFRGGLVIGIRPATVLSAIDLQGFFNRCNTAPCRDLGASARVSTTARTPFGRRVTWRYSDEGSPRAVGLEIVQTSWDGRPPSDYVIMEFSIRNVSGRTLELYPGLLTDWDTNAQAWLDVGGSDLGGRLMYQGNDGGGPLLGTLMLGDVPVSGTDFSVNDATAFAVTEIGLLRLITGEVSHPTWTTPGDLRYVHAVGPMTIRSHQSADFAIAIVAGETRQQLLANAAAAAADYATPGRGPMMR